MFMYQKCMYHSHVKTVFLFDLLVDILRVGVTLIFGLHVVCLVGRILVEGGSSSDEI